MPGHSYINLFRFGQYHGCAPILQRPLRNKLKAMECYINRSSWYLFRSTHCETEQL